MMIKSERQLAVLITQCFPSGTSVNRIESHATCMGFPDIEYYNNQSRGVIEVKKVQSSACRLPLRSSQWGWLRRRLGSGDKPLLIILSKKEEAIVVVPFSSEMCEGMTTGDIIEDYPHLVVELKNRQVTSTDLWNSIKQLQR